MMNIDLIRSTSPSILVLGNYGAIIQSILDFDYLSGKKESSVMGIIAGGRRTVRYFFGKKEILLPVYSDIEGVPLEKRKRTSYVLNLASGRRVLANTQTALNLIPNLIGGVIFAEEVPEKHSLDISSSLKNKKTFIIGPSSVGLLIPKVLKLGAIGGTEGRQLVQSKLFEPGDMAVFSSSGGMTNEIIRAVIQQNRRLSFALSFGGERFPIFLPTEAFLAAEDDPKTKTIVYFGELGGTDEYELADLISKKKIKKEVICYIAGIVADMFESPPQFGHAKALAKTDAETAVAKKKVLKDAGAKVADSFSEFVEMIGRSNGKVVKDNEEYSIIQKDMTDRKKALIASSISGDIDGEPQILGENLLSFAKDHSFAYISASLFLGRKIKSGRFEKCVDFILRQLVDHGPYVSGAVNTIIASRAGKDLVSSLSAGLLTIGPRFGGAINQAAKNWLIGVLSKKPAFDFVEDFASRKEYISGIGHKKYRVDYPDPRVKEILAYTDELSQKRFTVFAKGVEKITTEKKGNLILNVDGAIAAVLLDILSEDEHVSDEELSTLIDTEFFNAFFVLSRSVGFIAHFLDQKRLDEGLFRLEEDQVALSR